MFTIVVVPLLTKPAALTVVTRSLALKLFPSVSVPLLLSTPPTDKVLPLGPLVPSMLSVPALLAFPQMLSLAFPEPGIASVARVSVPVLVRFVALTVAKPPPMLKVALLFSTPPSANTPCSILMKPVFEKSTSVAMPSIMEMWKAPALLARWISALLPSWPFTATRALPLALPLRSRTAPAPIAVI